MMGILSVEGPFPSGWWYYVLVCVDFQKIHVIRSFFKICRPQIAPEKYSPKTPRGLPKKITFSSVSAVYNVVKEAQLRTTLTAVLAIHS